MVLHEIWRSMGTDSYLFVGDSESLFAVDSRFEYVYNYWSALFRKVDS